LFARSSKTLYREDGPRTLASEGNGAAIFKTSDLFSVSRYRRKIVHEYPRMDREKSCGQFLQALQTISSYIPDIKNSCFIV
jgi:hypothetical protein